MPREREKVRDRHREKTVVLLNVLIQLPTKWVLIYRFSNSIKLFSHWINLIKSKYIIILFTFSVLQAIRNPSAKPNHLIISLKSLNFFFILTCTSFRFSVDFRQMLCFFSYPSSPSFSKELNLLSYHLFYTGTRTRVWVSCSPSSATQEANFQVLRKPWVCGLIYMIITWNSALRGWSSYFY